MPARGGTNRFLTPFNGCLIDNRVEPPTHRKPTQWSKSARGSFQNVIEDSVRLDAAKSADICAITYYSQIVSGDGGGARRQFHEAKHVHNHARGPTFGVPRKMPRLT